MSLARLCVFVAACLSLAAPAMAQAPGGDVNLRPDPSVGCHVGVYRLDDGSWVDVAPAASKGLRWRRPDGSAGRMSSGVDGRWTSTLGSTSRVEGPQPQLAACSDGRITFNGLAGSKIALASQETTFIGHAGARLKGRLLLPPGAGPVPVMVELHGSEGANALDFNPFQRFAPASGVGVFVYAKRGSGGSEGRYTQDFQVLADDAAAAVAEVRRLAGKRASRIGLHGGSQAGWIAPLTAMRTPVDFVVVDYGLAYSPLQQERDLVLRHLKARGWDDAVLDKAGAVADAAAAVIASNGQAGFDRLDAAREAYRVEPWFDDVKGDFTGTLLKASDATIRAMLPQVDVQTPWTYDPLPALMALDAPTLWILAERDSRAPPEATRRRLIDLSAKGRPITVLQYPDTDHGLVRFETDAQGRRTSLGNPPGYFDAVLDWARYGRLKGRYGDGRCLTGRGSGCR